MPRCHLALAATLLGSVAQAASITDLATWTLVEDPADPNLSASVNGSSEAELSGFGPVPSGTDIGYASVDGADVANSTAGYYFDPGADFSVAVDYALLTRSSTGAGGIGFGIGEDADGTDSAGVALGVVNGQPLAFSGAGRVGDVDQPLQLFATPPTAIPSVGGTIYSSDGRFFLEYDSATKDVVVGVSTTPGASTPDETQTFSAIGLGWDDEPLLVSFFLRSQAVSVIPGLQSGLVQATFSNFEVLGGAPVRLPEPTAAALMGVTLAWGLSRRR